MMRRADAWYADLHVHSRYSRATSRDCDLEHLAAWAQRKGIAVVGTGDFTHPAWRAQLREQLQPAEPGLFELRPEIARAVTAQVPAACVAPVRFLLSTEISTIYKKGDRTRKVHHLVLAPDFEAVDRLVAPLERIGNLHSDGRPILGLDSRHLLELVLASGPASMLIPAHVWTPWFSVLGSRSGFDAVEDCYGDLTDHVVAIETGLSSDPPMNWRVSALDRYRLVSNSDAHSPDKLGREATVFCGPCDYFAIRGALQTGQGYVGTVEFFPEEGKYHLDGHRNCNVRMTPCETRAAGGLCPVCGRPVTVGVSHRVEDLADRLEPAPPATAGEVRSLIPLTEVIGEVRGTGPQSKGVRAVYDELLARLGPELSILGDVPLDEVRRVASDVVVEALARLRAGQVRREGGYDGEYGVMRLFGDDELEGRRHGEALLFDWPAAEKGRGVRHAERGAGDKTGSDGARSREEGAGVAGDSGDTCPGAEQEAASGATLDAGPNGRVGEMLESAIPTDGLSGVLAGLDPEQRAGAEVTNGPVLIVAGPGSGKTRLLTHRIAHLVRDQGAVPEQVLAITFTRRAAAEMRERLERLLGEATRAVTVTTFHGLGLTLLETYGACVGVAPGFRVADETERQVMAVEVLGLGAREAGRLLTRMSRVKRAGEALDETAARFQEVLRDRNLLDFDDLVGLAVLALESEAAVREACRQRFRWVSVDEYQDVDALQYRLIRLLAPADANLCVIGDPHQAIYGFRGADVRFFERFRDDYPAARAIHLHRNYRSGRCIVEASTQVMAAASDAARATAVRGTASLRVTVHAAPTEAAEAEFVVHSVERMLGGHSFFSLDSARADGGTVCDLGFSDVAVLYRTDAQADALCEALQRSGMPYQKRSHAPLGDHAGVRTLVAGLGAARESVSGARGAADPDGCGAGAGVAVPVVCDARLGAPVAGPTAAKGQDAARGSVECRLEALAAASIDGVEPRTLSDALDLLRPLARACGDDVARFRSRLALECQVDTWDPRADAVSLLTLHAAKGLEFRVVFLVGCEDGLLPLRWGGSIDADSEAAVAEERRLFYVGMTRAQDRLFLCRARRRLWHGKLQERAPSPFLDAIAERLLEYAHPAPPPLRRPQPRGEQLALFGEQA